MRLERIARFFGLSHKLLTPPHNLQDIKPIETPSSKSTVSTVCDVSKQREASLRARPQLANKISISETRNITPIGTQPQKLNNYNIAIIITGPFGSGKDTIANQFIKDESLNIQKVVLHTTREKGPNEVNGREYHFIDREKFYEMIKNNEFIQWNEFKTGCYGTAESSVKSLTNNGKNAIFAVGVNVANTLKIGLKNANISFVEIFVSPLSQEDLDKPGGIDKAIEILKERMIKRGRGEKEFDLLIQTAREWLSEAHNFTNVVENSDGKLDFAISSITNIIQAKQAELKTKSLASKSPQLKFLETGELPEIHLDTTKMKANKNIAVIVTGPSGVGKDTLFKELAKDIKFTEPLSHTTRLKRKEEKEGVNYYYISMDEFEKMIDSNNFVEWVMVHNDQFYGKTVETTQRALDSGNDLVYALNISAREYYKAVFEKFGIPHTDVFLSPIPKEELEKPLGIDKAVSILEKRIRRRNSGETEEQIQDRLKVAREWLKEAKKYSHIIANVEGGLDNAVREFKQILLPQK